MSNLNLQKLREWVWLWPWTFKGKDTDILLKKVEWYNMGLIKKIA